MRFIQFIVPFLLCLTMVACQDENSAGLTLPATTAAADQERDQPVDGSRTPPGKGNKNEIHGLTGEDARALLNGRLLLTTFLNQTEGIAAPLAEQWRLEQVEMAEGERRIFTFSSGEWSLILEEPGPAAAGILYHAQISGPDRPAYLADIHRDGSVFPAQ